MLDNIGLKNTQNKKSSFKGGCCKMFKVGVFGDTHINSKRCDYKNLLKTIDYFNKNVDVVFHTGDLIDGRRVYRGQDFELETLLVDDMIEKAGNIMSRLKRPTYWILGNHDYSLIKHFGVDISKELKFKNWHFLGYFVGDTRIKDLEFRVLHPAGGKPYSISYTAQRYLRNINFKKEHFDWLLMGHLHKPYFFEIQGVSVLGNASYQHLTDFARRRGYEAEIGYWIINFRSKHDYYLKKRVF